MTDAELLDILNFENSGRDDVHPLDESAGWREWMKQTGKGTSDIAERIGKSHEYVWKALKYEALIPEARERFLADRHWGGHAILIARLPERYQREALNFCFPSFDPDRHVSVRQLAAWIKTNCMLSLRFCGFDPADEGLLPVTGSCDACPKRSGSSPEIFGDLEDSEICTDPSCYRLKQIAAAALKPAPAPPRPPPVPAPKPAKLKPGAAQKREEDIAAEQERAEEDRRLQEERAADQKRVQLAEVRADKVYARALDAILEKVTWPISQEDFAAILAFTIGAMECHAELADKFAIPKSSPVRWQDIVAAIPRLPAQKLARVAIAGILIDVRTQEGQYLTSNHPLAQFAKRYKVDLAKISSAVEAELNPPAEATRREVAKPAAKKAPPTKKPAPAAKKAKQPAAKKKGALAGKVPAKGDRIQWANAKRAQRAALGKK